ncbi:MAG: sigma-70 family RNA polymerase sigma factor [Clostridia bacterium]|nr:sigma-70 family RNA polymerase sigma factor [Clostridia bacterium]
MTSISDDFTQSTDEVLVKLAQAGVIKAENCIFERYRKTVEINAATFISNFATYCAMASLEFDDLFQEGLLGLLSAIYSFHEEKNVTFRTFAAKCISNSIRSVIKASTRKKNTPSGGVISLNDIDIPTMTSLEDKIISAEGTAILYDFLQTELSALELSVIRLYLAGISYRDISEKLGIAEKSVDNAIQRIRGKLSRFLNENRS